MKFLQKLKQFFCIHKYEHFCDWTEIECFPKQRVYKCVEMECLKCQKHKIKTFDK